MSEKKENTKGVFLEKIEFENAFGPFEKGTKIYFNDGMRNILKFYLKNKDGFSEEDAKSVAERMKINVIVGENGTGKTKLLRYIRDKYIEISFLDNISLFDFVRDKKFSNSEKTKLPIYDIIGEFLESTKWTHDIGIVDRFLKYIALYSYFLKEEKIKTDVLGNFVGLDLESFDWNLQVGENKEISLYEVVGNIILNGGEYSNINNKINEKIRRDSSKVKLVFSDDIQKLLQKSSGAKILMLRFSFYLIYIQLILNKTKEGENQDKTNKKTIKNFIILIDEPDLHLHLDWQRQYIQKLIDVFGEFLKDQKDISLHFIIATHSPFILSDIPAENVILLQKGKDGFTKVTDWWGRTFDWLDNNSIDKPKNDGTFGANFVDLIRDGFFFQSKNLMGSFAEGIIDKIAEERRQEITNGKEIDKDIIKGIEDKIGDSFLKDNLLYFKKSDAEDRNGK